MTEVTFCPKEAIENQSEFCNKYSLPLLAPEEGICFKCNRNIYMPYIQGHGKWVVSTGITVDKAGEQHITYCPHCNKSFSD